MLIDIFCTLCFQIPLSRGGPERWVSSCRKQTEFREQIKLELHSGNQDNYPVPDLAWRVSMQPAGSIWLMYTTAELRSGKTEFSQEYDGQLTTGIPPFSCQTHQESHGRKSYRTS